MSLKGKENVIAGTKTLCALFALVVKNPFLSRFISGKK